MTVTTVAAADRDRHLPVPADRPLAAVVALVWNALNVGARDVHVVFGRDRHGAVGSVGVTPGPGRTALVDAGSAELAALASPRARRRLVREFARYLLRCGDVAISYDGVRLDPARLVTCVHSERLRLPGTWSAQPAVLEVVEWCEPFPRDLVLCDGDGVGLAEVGLDVRQRGLSLTAYLDWSGFDRTRADGIAGTHRAAVESAVDQVHAYLQARAGERFREAAGHHPPRRPTSIPF